MKIDVPFSLKRGALIGAAGLFAVFLSGCGGGSSNGSSTASSIAATLAGSGESGSADGAGDVARFNNPVNVATDTLGNVYVCDFDGNRIRRINSAGVVSTLTNQANFERPFGITIAPDGRLYVSTDSNDTGGRDATTGTLWQINTSTGAATVVARNLGRPRGLAALSSTQIVLVDLTQNDVRLINPDTKIITPLAGPTVRGTAGFVNGNGSEVRFNRPYGPAITPSGNILLADQGNNALRLITPGGEVITYAGNGTAGNTNGTRFVAKFNGPQDVDLDSRGNIYVSDNGNHVIRRISTSGTVSTFAGDGTAGYRDGAGAQARFFGQEGLAVNRTGTTVYVADGTGGDDVDFNRIRKLTVK